MTEKRFNIIFTGVINAGFNEEEVKSKAKQIFHIDDAKIAALFRGKPTVLKKNVDASSAQKYQKVLQSIGMQADIQPYASQASSAPQPPATSQSSVADATLRLLPNDDSQSLSRDVQAGTMAVDDVKIDVPNWEVGQVGEWLTEPDNSLILTDDSQVVASLAHVTLAPVAADLLSPDEKLPTPEVAPLETIDNQPVNSITLSSIGDDLLHASERKEFVDASLNIDHLSIKTNSGDLLAPEEKQPCIEKDIDTRHICFFDDNSRSP